MNRLLVFFAALVFCVGAFGANAQEEDEFLPLNEHEEGRTKISLVAHVFPPFQYRKNGIMVGPMIEIMRRVCDEAMVNCVIHMHAFLQAYRDVLDGEADVIFSFALLDDKPRLELFSYSPPLVKTTYSFFVTSTSNWRWTGKIDDLNGRTIGVYGPSGTQIIARDLVSQNPTAKLVVEDTTLRAFQRLVVGQYGASAAVVSNRDVGLALLKSANIYGPKVAGDIAPVEFGFAISRTSKNFDIAPRLITAAQILKNKGVAQDILRSYELEAAP